MPFGFGGAGFGMMPGRPENPFLPGAPAAPGGGLGFGGPAPMPPPGWGGGGGINPAMGAAAGLGMGAGMFGAGPWGGAIGQRHNLRPLNAPSWFQGGGGSTSPFTMSPSYGGSRGDPG